MIHSILRSFPIICLIISYTLISCTQKESSNQATLNWESVQDSTDIVTTIEGFQGPEAVRYDPDQDHYFVSNFNGPGVERDANGFISKVSPEGSIDVLRFMVGTENNPMHAPRGMYITGDTLWAADADGIHGFNRMTGDQIAFIDFTSFEPGFLNDVVQGADGALYVTDTGNSAVYKIENGTPSAVVDSLPYPPNGITIDSGDRLILAPWDGGLTFYNLTDEDPGYTDYINAENGGNFDGIEFVNGRMLAASQIDSSLHVLREGEDHIAIHVPGRPADIGLDTKRRQVAVPYIDLNRIDIWQLPE